MKIIIHYPSITKDDVATQVILGFWAEFLKQQKKGSIIAEYADKIEVIE